MQESLIYPILDNKLCFTSSMLSEIETINLTKPEADLIQEIEVSEISFKDNTLYISLFNFILTLKNLHKLSFLFCGLSTEIIEKLSETLKINPSLQELYIIGSSMDDKDVILLADILRTHSQLSVLDLSKTSLNTGLDYLLQQIKNIKTLVKLRLRGYTIDINDAHALQCLLEENKMLQYIDLSETEMGNDILNSLLDILIKGRKLLSLGLAFNKFTHAVTQKLINAIEISQLKELNVAYNFLNNFGDYSRDLFTKNTSLEILNLSFNGLNDEQTLKLFSSLIENQHIKCLDLTGNEITSNLLNKIGEFLKTNSSLSKLILDKNKLDSNMQCLVDALKVNTSLQELSLAENKINEDDIRAFEDLFTENITLQELNLEPEYSEKKFDKIEKYCQRNKDPNPLQYEVLTAKAKKTSVCIPSLLRISLFATKNYLRNNELLYKEAPVNINSKKNNLISAQSENPILTDEVAALVFS